MAYVGRKNYSWYAERMAFKTATSDLIFELSVIELRESKAVLVVGGLGPYLGVAEYLH